MKMAPASRAAISAGAKKAGAWMGMGHPDDGTEAAA
jgi:hypothetical protein